MDCLPTAWASWRTGVGDLFGATNVLGVEATLAAWLHGDGWLTRLTSHLLSQRDNLAARVADLPGVTMRRPQAGYLAWLDCATPACPTIPRPGSVSTQASS
jgi:cystathionine beta-lyase